jgi:hypothetical protein
VRFAALLLAPLGLLTAGHHAGSFPCQWRWDLQAGLRSGYETAGASAYCGGRSGSLTISIKLSSWTAKTHKWRPAGSATQTFRDLSHNRYVEIARRCRTELVRGDFTWILRDGGGSVVARHSVRGRTNVPGPNCQIHLG